MAQVPSNTVGSAGIGSSAYGTPVPDLALTGVLLGIFVVALLVGLAVFIYQAIAFMTIARKTGTPNGWLAFIPIANVYLMWRISRTPVWTLVTVLVISFASFAGYVTAIVSGSPVLFLAVMGFVVLASLVSIGLMAWWYWRIADERGYPGAIGLLASPLVTMIPYLNMLTWPIPLVTIGVLAWRDPK